LNFESHRHNVIVIPHSRPPGQTTRRQHGTMPPTAWPARMMASLSVH